MQVLNINEGVNEDLKEACRTLREYMQYVDKVRAYIKNMSIDEAVERAVEECVGQGILREFLLQNRAERDEKVLLEWLKLAGSAADSKEIYQNIGSTKGQELLRPHSSPVKKGFL